MKRAEHRNVNLLEGFWKKQLDKINSVTIWDVLDKFEHDSGEGVLKNYKWVAEGVRGKHVGHSFYDGLFCEVIRAASDLLSMYPNEQLEKKLDSYIELIDRAQTTDPDGYLNTYTTLLWPNKRWGQNGGNLLTQHDLYNMGCLVEAGIHHYKATGKTSLLKCSLRIANCVCNTMGPVPRKNIVPSHSIAEEAIVKLYRLMKEEEELVHRIKEEFDIMVEPERYLAVVQFWMDHRGVHEGRASFPHYLGEYAQDHCKIEFQTEVVGHAVRAALMYAGLAALGIESGDKKYLEAADRLWENMGSTKLHISGGIGAIHNEERFGYQYDLPNNAYLETCASVALAIWAGEMHRAFGKSKYVDVLETALYNNVLAGLSLDGKKYFYQNPLVSDGTIERWSWHGCPCCPPMLLKLMASLPDYIYSYEGDRLAVNLFINSKASLPVADTIVGIEQTGELPWSGRTEILLHLSKDTAFCLAIRRPAWAENFRVIWKGSFYDAVDENGYVVIAETFKEGDKLTVEMELPIIKVEAHPYVWADFGRVALMRGPLLYCLEEADNPHGVEPILGRGKLQTIRMELDGIVTGIQGDDTEGKSFLAVPYYLWNNRMVGKMSVWLRQDGKDGMKAAAGEDGRIEFVPAGETGGPQTLEVTGWENKLYRRFS